MGRTKWVFQSSTRSDGFRKSNMAMGFLLLVVGYNMLKYVI